MSEKTFVLTEQEFQGLCTFFSEVALPFKTTGPYIQMLEAVLRRHNERAANEQEAAE